MAKVVEEQEEIKTDHKPIMTKEEIKESYQKSIEEFQNALDLDTPKGIFEYLKAPGIVVVSVAVAYVIGRFRFSFLFLIPLVYAIFFKFKNRMEKFKTSLQVQVYNQVRREKVRNNFETVEWINYIISRFWTVAEPIVAEEVFRNINTFLYENCPNFLKSLRLTEFTLGSVSPKVTGILFFESLSEEVIQLDIELVFVPLEISKELFYFVKKDKKNQFNSNITLVAKMGTKGTDLGISLPISVKNLAFRGLARVIITLTNNQFFTKEVEFCFLEEPYINFTLKPLKALDVMDLPGLSSWIKGVINSNLKKQLINPNSIKINLEKMVADKKENIGVLCLQLLEYESRNNEEIKGELEIDGKKYFDTQKKEGNLFTFNEYFYFVIQNVDEFVSLNIHSEAKGSLLLKRFILGDVLESMRVIDKHGIRAALKCAGHFYKLIPAEGKKHLTNSAVITLKIGQVEELQAKNASPSKTYTSFCTVLVSPDRLITKKEDGNQIIKNTISATTNIFGGIFDVITGAKASEKLLTSTKSTLFIHRSKIIVDSNSPKYNDTCTFFSRDLKNDILKICVTDTSGENANILGSVEVSLYEVYTGMKQWYKLNEAQKGKIELEFNIDYIDLTQTNRTIDTSRIIDSKNNDSKKKSSDSKKSENYNDKNKNDKNIIINTINKNDLRDYKVIYSVDLKECSSMFGYGSYFLIFKTDSLVIKTEKFCVGISEYKRNVLIPLEENDSIQVYLYKESAKEENFIGKGTLLSKGESVDSGDSLILGKHPLLTEEKVKESVIKSVSLKKDKDGNDTANVILQIKRDILSEYDGVSDNINQAKIIQVRFSEIKMKEECRIEFRSNEELIFASQITNKSDEFTFVSGKDEVMAVFKSLEIGKDEVIGSCLVPKRQLNESILINDTDRVKMNVKTSFTNFLTFTSLKKGSLKITLLELKQLTFLQDTACKVFINDSQVYRTKVVKKCMTPSFNETITTYLDKRYDTLRIVVQNWMQFEPSKVIGVIDTPLYFLEEGKFTHNLRLSDGNNLLDTYLVVEFEFSKGDLYGLKKKKNTLGGFLPF